MLSRKEILERDYDAALKFIDKVDGQLFTIRSWTLVAVTALIAFSFQQGISWLAFGGVPIVLCFLYLELVYKSFQDDVINFTSRIDKALQTGWEGIDFTGPWESYRVGMGRAILRPDLKKICATFLHKDKIHIKAMYSMAALACILAGFLVNSVESPGDGTPAIVRSLEEIRISIDALRQPHDPEPPPDVIYGFRESFMLGVLLLLIGLTVSFQNPKKAAVATGIGTLSLLYSFHLLETNFENLLALNFEVGGQASPRISIGHVTIEWPEGNEASIKQQGRAQFQFRKIAEIEGFASGAEALSGRNGCSIVEQRYGAGLKDLGQDAQPVLLLVVGRTDREALGENLKRRYESNAALATRRAEWARDCIVNSESLKLPERSIVALPAGPRFVSMLNEPEGMAADRAVEIFALSASYGVDGDSSQGGS